MCECSQRAGKILPLSVLLVVVPWSCGCDGAGSTGGMGHAVSQDVREPGSRLREGGIGVLLVSHGSHSPEWRKMLMEFHDCVETQLRELPGVQSVKSAFMEYTEPSIATQLKALDDEGCSEVILVPLLLTVSSHSFDDIPTIIGAKDDARSLLAMRTQRIERYVPQARVTITPLLDFSELLGANVPRRVSALTQEPSREGVVLVAYGDETYNEQWDAFFSKLDRAVEKETGVAEVRHCWCGHIVRYSKEPTQDAILKILHRHERAIVIPVLVARDPFFQGEIIGGAIEELDSGDRIIYLADAILPDPKLNEWVISITRQACAGLAESRDFRGGESR